MARPSREEAEAAVRTLLSWAGDDPEREGLLETPKRVVKAYEELFRGYGQKPGEILAKTFQEVGGYDEIVLLTNIGFESYCEHHLVPIVGRAHVGYIPKGAVVGLSKIARLVDCFAKRLQIQEKMTTDIAGAIEEHLGAKAVAVIVEAEHQCMSSRGVSKHGVMTTTSCMRGLFRDDSKARGEVLALIANARS